MDALLALVIAAWAWLDETLQGIIDAHPFLVLFFGILFLFQALQRHIDQRFDALNQQIYRIGQSSDL